MRGPEQHDTDEGAEMFSMTRNQFLGIRSIVPSVDHEDYSWLCQQSCPDAFISRVATLTIKCSEFRMKADRILTRTQRDPRRVQDVLDLLRTAQELSKKLAKLDQPQSAVWRVQKTSGVGGPADEQPPGDVYNFHNLYVCMIFNIIWTSHLFLTSCIFRCMAWLVAPGEWRFGDEYEAAVEVTRRRVADITAAVPYACSWDGYNNEFAGFPCGSPQPNSTAKGVAGMCVFRPAFTAMMSDYATPEQKQYLEGRLRFLADGVGIKQVNVLLRVCSCSFPPLVFMFSGSD